MDNRNDRRDRFEVYRDYVTHEDNLIKNRMTWLILVQSFFFTSFALAVVRLSDSDPIVAEKITVFLHTTAWLGIAVGLATCGAVLAALNSIDGLRSLWDILRTDNNAFTNDKTLPELTGGGKTFASIYGVLLPIVVPLIFAVTWGYLLVEL